MARRGTTRWSGARWPAAALALVFADDLLLTSRHWSVPVLAMLDEPAHLATAALLLAAVGAQRSRPVLLALAASVAIDLDHVPLYAGAPMGAHGRPPTHSLLTVAALTVAGLLIRRRRRDLMACAAGVALHLVRDLATGPGVPLAWPLEGHDVTTPYGAYAALLVLAAIAAAGARVRVRSTTLRPPS